MSLFKYLFVIFLFCLASKSVQAQSFDIRLFENSKGKKINENQKNISEYKKITKQNKAYLKSQRKKYKAHRDSLRFDGNSKNRDSLSRLERLQKQYFIYTNQWHSKEEIQSWDSTKLKSQKKLLEYSKNRLTGNYYYDKYIGMNSKIVGYQKELKNYRDSLKANEDDKDKREYLVEIKKKELSNKYGKDLEDRAAREAQSRANINFPSNNPELQEVLQYQDVAKKATQVNQSKAKGMNYFEGKEKVLAKAMDQSSELKKKYSKVVNSNDLSTATKRNSLKGTTFWGRLVFGGTFQIHIDKQSSIDLNPELAYRINKKWDLGIRGNYRVNAAIDDLLGAVKEQKVYGYRVFTEYQLYKSFYGHVEWESLAASTVDANTDVTTVVWNNSLFAGIERRFSIGSRVEAQVSLLYNFLHDNNPLYNSPWNVRFGFNFKGKDKNSESK